MKANGIGDLLAEAGYEERIKWHEPLAKYTSFEIGGPADLLVVAREARELIELVTLARQADTPVRVIGSGTNILVADRGVRGMVIVNRARGYRIDEQGLLVAESGAMMTKVARRVSEGGWAGLTWAAGIPGTIGGAVVGNAGAHGGSVADSLVWVDWVTSDGTQERVPVEHLQYGYRASVLKSDPQCGESRIVLLAAFQMESGTAGDLEAQIANVLARRSARTPLGRCAGSVFKRTLHYPAGFLIEQAGLKGHRIGDAQVSPKHANFLMNVGSASAADMKALIELVQQRVWETFGERLEPEIQFVGEWN